MEDFREKHVYQKSDCLLIGACKEYFHEEAHSAVCDSYAQFICDQINNKSKYADKFKRAIDIEQLFLDLFFEQKHWSKTFVYMYTVFKISQNYIKEGDISRVLSLYYSIHRFICNNLSTKPNELIEWSDDK